MLILSVMINSARVSPSFCDAIYIKVTIYNVRFSSQTWTHTPKNVDFEYFMIWHSIGYVVKSSFHETIASAKKDYTLLKYK